MDGSGFLRADKAMSTNKPTQRIGRTLHALKPPEPGSSGGFGDSGVMACYVYSATTPEVQSSECTTVTAQSTVQQPRLSLRARARGVSWQPCMRA